MLCFFLGTIKREDNDVIKESLLGGLDVDRYQTTSTKESPCNLWTSNSSAVLNPSCITQISRTYSLRHDVAQWCLAPSHQPNIFLKRPQLISNNEEPVVGIIFIKNTKAASSTGAGVTLRIAEQVGRRVLHHPPNNNNINQTTLAPMSCVRNWTHAFANHRGHAHRHATRSVLWTIVRQPDKRDVSAFVFFEHARKGVPMHQDNNQDTVLAYLQAQKSGQFRYLHDQYIADENLQPDFQKWYQTNSHNLSTILQEMLQRYDFIALAERWQESLAVLTLLWNLRVEDVIVLSSKTKGGYDDGKFRKQCHKIPHASSLLSSSYGEVQDYLQLSHATHNLDHALYAAANASLDRTIQSLGFEKVQRQLQRVKQLQDTAERACKTVAVYPCSSIGVLQRAAAKQSCYIDDSGCGHACVDEVLRVENV
ncbi:expressed unknown protein [Seminavis robusta]|uniref:Uncharacterized protein n=1 Tax=Seminavis robusta TaxID=568900 RepID=A0A9N8EG07_9STRA|nr:expressed unknown protein [Seminavis robusta]|eukprot:Sro1024_g232650.1 n/a (423) ;mRNA; f:17419-18687